MLGASIAMLVGFELLLLGCVLPAAFAPWVLVVGCVSVVVGGVTLASLPGPYRRLFAEVKRLGLPDSHLTAARWAATGDGCMDAWRDLAVTKLCWYRYCDGFPMREDDYAALAESLRRCARRRHPGSLQLSPLQSAYLQRGDAAPIARSSSPESIEDARL